MAEWQDGGVAEWQEPNLARNLGFIKSHQNIHKLHETLQDNEGDYSP